MKLLLVTYGLNSVGGLQSWQHLFTHKMLERGHSITILEMFDFSEKIPTQKFVRQWHDNIRIIKVNGPIIARGYDPNTNLNAVKVILNVWRKIKLANFVSREGFDALLLPDPNFAFFFFKQTLKQTHCIVQYHSSFDRFKSTSKLRYLLVKSRIKAFKKFVLLSSGDVNRAIDNGFPPNKLTFMFNFIDESKFKRFKKISFKRSKQILVVGNLDNPDKQFDHLLRAFSLIDSAIRVEWKIKVIGGGSAREALMILAEKLGIAESVYFAGKKSDPVIDFFESDFYVLTSLFEGFPLTLLECIFSNLPIVSYACAPAIDEIVTHDINGLVVEKNNIHSLSGAIQHLILNDSVLMRMSENQEMFKQKFDSQKMVEKWEDLLFPVLKP